MDFRYSDDQQSIVDLAGQLLAEQSTHERQRALETGDGPRFDRELWAQLAETGLLGVAIPEAQGGAGLGFQEVAAICEAIGRHTAPIPFLETVVLAGLPIAEFGSPAQREAWLPKLVAGEAVLTAALQEDQAEPEKPATRAHREHDGDGDGWVLSGSKIPVPAAELADCVLVPASVEGADVGLFLLDPRAEGVRLVGLETPTGQPASLLQLDRVRVGPDAVLGSIAAGRTILEWLLLRATAAQCAMGVGICQAALEMTTEYIKERKQFGQPIAMFQAVGHRAADAFIDVQGIQLTTLQACWRVAAGLPATREVALAKYWVAEAGARVVAAAQHLHGGIGVDRDYPVHRFYLYAKQLELDLGGSTDQLRRIGRILAEMPFDTAV
ncbi:MAG: acyl-CoA dehydrogenase family protein [Myxococcota bacterium]|nr:acyl-CoA dehydrogenase family protein [Myxococcota bacterium]